MARITFTPLVSDVRASIGDITFSRWKGIPYVRQRVDPANPNTLAQQAIRASLTATVYLWQSLSNTLQGYYNAGASPLGYSGYNDFTSRNRAQIQAEDGLYGPRRDPELAGGTVKLPTNVNAATGASGAIDLTWTDDGGGTDDHVGVIVYNPDNGSLALEDLDLALLSAESHTIDGLATDQLHLIAVMGYNSDVGAAQHASPQTAASGA